MNEKGKSSPDSYRDQLYILNIVEVCNRAKSGFQPDTFQSIEEEIVKHNLSL